MVAAGPLLQPGREGLPLPLVAHGATGFPVSLREGSERAWRLYVFSKGGLTLLRFLGWEATKQDVLTEVVTSKLSIDWR